MNVFKNKKVVFSVLAAVFAALAGVGVTNTDVLSFSKSESKGAEPRVIIETLDPTLLSFAPYWRDEIGRRFDNAVGILVHGADFVEGQWIVGTHYQSFKHVSPVQEVVRRYQELYPDRTIVLLACNTGSCELGIPGVYYAKSSVWCVPDRQVGLTGMFNHRTLAGSWVEVAMGLATRSDVEPDFVGNIYEFVCD